MRRATGISCPINRHCGIVSRWSCAGVSCAGRALEPRSIAASHTRLRHFRARLVSRVCSRGHFWHAHSHHSMHFQGRADASFPKCLAACFGDFSGKGMRCGIRAENKCIKRADNPPELRAYRLNLRCDDLAPDHSHSLDRQRLRGVHADQRPQRRGMAGRFCRPGGDRAARLALSASGQ